MANIFERAYIKDILQVQDVHSFKGEVYLKPEKKHHKLEVWGNVKAELAVQSVISLDLFTVKHNIDFELLFDTKMNREEQRALEEAQDNVPDIIEAGQIDLAAILIEQVALNMDDYPRKKGEVFEFQPDFDPDEPVQENPFNILKNIKK